MNTTKLWANVCTTDPKYTKEFSRSGGFKGTAINPTYNNMKATEVFGPVGLGWGWEIVNSQFLDSSDGSEKLHILEIHLWYRLTPRFCETMGIDPASLTGEGDTPKLWSRCVVPAYGQTMICGKNKYGLFMDEEAPKKSLTDAIGKALSCLGFSADIHLGLYDSSKYVNDVKAQFKGEKTAAPAEKAKPKAAPAANDATATFTPMTEETTKVIQDHLPNLQTTDDVQAYWKDICETFGISKERTPAEYAEWRSRFSQRAAQIREANHAASRHDVAA